MPDVIDAEIESSGRMSVDLMPLDASLADGRSVHEWHTFLEVSAQNTKVQILTTVLRMALYTEKFAQVKHLDRLQVNIFLEIVRFRSQLLHGIVDLDGYRFKGMQE